MTTIRNEENLPLYKELFAISAFASSTNLVRKVKKNISKFQTTYVAMFYFTKNFHFNSQ